MMITNKTFFNGSLIFCLILILTGCGPGSMEDQVKKIHSPLYESEITQIGYSLADSIDIKAPKLLIATYPVDSSGSAYAENSMEHRNIRFTQQKVILALKAMVYRYSEINDTKIKDCLSYIADPNLSPNLGNDKKLELISYGLTIKNNLIQEGFFEILADLALKHEESGMLALIDNWNMSKDANLLYALKLFDEKLLDHLCNLMVFDENAIDLLARMGESVIPRIKREMRSSDRERRFAAGDVLVKMIQYHPEALNSLTSAIDKSGTRTIAKNYPFYIRLGQKNTEDILLKALRYNFSTTMCVDYLNCGNSKLEDGATQIASDNGYIVTPSFGNNNGPRWGAAN